jgi:hypothetical protein
MVWIGICVRTVAGEWNRNQFNVTMEDGVQRRMSANKNGAPVVEWVIYL